MKTQDFIPLPDPSLKVLHKQLIDNKIQLFVQDPSMTTICPKCSTITCEPHIQYTRVIKDLPTNNKAVEFILISKKWYCLNDLCETKIFTQRYSWVRPHKSITVRAEQLLLRLGASMSCLSAEKVAHSMNLPVSHDYILSLIKEQEFSPEVSPFCRCR